MIKVDCEEYAQRILDDIKAVPQEKKTKKLCIISVGDNPASESYMKGKKKDCDYCGIPWEHISIPVSDDAYEVQYINLFRKTYDAICRANCDPSIGGIILQLPLPREVFTEEDERILTDDIMGEKDVDGFTPDSIFHPCTPEGIMYLIHSEIGEVEGKKVLVIGRGKLVGKPLVDMLLNENATVTIAHSHSNIDSEIQMGYDVIVTATGVPKLFTNEFVNASLIIDAGISRNEEGKICGDMKLVPEDWEWSPTCKYTPVPKGVGLMTRAMLMRHMMEVQ